MKRRDAISAIAGLIIATPLGVRAQQRTAKVPKIGVLWHAANAGAEEPYISALRDGFIDLGYVDGQNITFEHRFPSELPDRFKAMAAELVALPVDVLVGVGAAASPFVKQATSVIPIVFVIVPDPVGSKLVESLARPGGNATGMSTLSPELSGKRLELIKETIPELTRVAVLINPDAKISDLYIQEAQAAANKLGLSVEIFEARSLNQLPKVFEAIARAGVRAMMINQEGLFFVGRAQIAELAIQHRLVTCVWSPETLRAGALMSYGPNLVAICRRTAVFVQKILNGSKPDEIPVEQPTKFEFGINLKTAQALGMQVPPMLVARADEVIE
jgi:putative ABC transport system substrate-binding protein